MAAERSSWKLQISPTQLSIEEGAGRQFAIHRLWLRERCQDAKSMALLTGQRLHDPADLHLDLSYAALAETDPGHAYLRSSHGHLADFVVDHILAEAALPAGAHDVPAYAMWTGAFADIPKATWRYAASRSAQ